MHSTSWRKRLPLKLDEMIRAIKTARNSLIDIEDLSDDELNRFHDQFQRMREKRAQVEKRSQKRDSRGSESRSRDKPGGGKTEG